MKKGEKIPVENINTPGKTTNVDASKYAAMRAALLSVLPKESPGMNQREMMDAVAPHLPESLFPGGSTSGWWVKTVQLDLEAKGVVIREQGKPLRWHQGS
ncbi:MAG: hypothetical protein AAGG55_12100 [Pseudomonadota bacterium]